MSHRVWFAPAVADVTGPASDHASDPASDPESDLVAGVPETDVNVGHRAADADTVWDHLIVGAGPAGLQMAHCLAHDGCTSFRVLEAGAVAGSFFQRYPVSGGLISVNKVHTGSTDPEFNLRHDWNSLLDLSVLEDGAAPGAGVWMRDESRAYFPRREDLARYLMRYAEHHRLPVQYHQRVAAVRRVPDPQLGDSHDTVFECTTPAGTRWYGRHLWWATGLEPVPVPDTLARGHEFLTPYGEVAAALADPVRRARWENEEVVVWGNGNAALEVANLLTPVCSRVHLLGTEGSRPWSWSSHYPGDLRGTYAAFLDTFLLKSMNTINCLPRQFHIYVKPVAERLGAGPDSGADPWAQVSHVAFYRYDPRRQELNRVEGLSRVAGIVNCVGWHAPGTMWTDPSVQPQRTPSGKFWRVHPDFEVCNVPRMYVLGTLMHTLDMRISAGSFIHGFRYLVRWAFEHHVRRRYRVTAGLTADEVAHRLAQRVDRASAPYQMFGYMGDLTWCDRPRDPTNPEARWTYVEDVHVPTVLSSRNPWHTAWATLAAAHGAPGPDLGQGCQAPTPGTGLPVFILTLEHAYKLLTDTRDLGWRAEAFGIVSPGNETRSALLHPVCRVMRFPWSWRGVEDANQEPRYTYVDLTTHPASIEEVHLSEDLRADFSAPHRYLHRFQRLLRHVW